MASDEAANAITAASPPPSLCFSGPSATRSRHPFQDLCPGGINAIAAPSQSFSFLLLFFLHLFALSRALSPRAAQLVPGGGISAANMITKQTSSAGPFVQRVVRVCRAFLPLGEAAEDAGAHVAFGEVFLLSSVFVPFRRLGCRIRGDHDNAA